MHLPERQPRHREVLFSTEEVNRGIGSVALEIVENYRDLDPLFVALMRGGGPFAYDTAREIAILDPTFNVDLDFIIISTYGSGQIARVPHIVADIAPDTRVKDRVVVSMDDISDSGKTFEFFKNHMLNKGAARVEQAVLVDRQVPKTSKPEIAALKTSTRKFLSGKGLDDRGVGHEANRHLSYVAIAWTQKNENLD
jgi:hypoxanthine phosphoribosyltransferase